MKVSDYMVEFLIKHKIQDVFGYPGGMVTHLMDSLDKYRGQITAHLNYHEQACAMAACAWAEITGRPGVAYATSGPGATNLLTGVACAYFDSVPCIFITGQVNTYEQKGDLTVRQRGFQETDIVAMARPITKAAFMVEKPEDVPAALDKAYSIAAGERPGPVLLDIPMDVFRGEVGEKPPLRSYQNETPQTLSCETCACEIMEILRKAQAPVILAGHGIALSGTAEVFREFARRVKIPVVTSMIAIDVLPADFPYAYGIIGAYGSRWANFIIDHSDCVLALGSRLDCRQTGVNKELFAPGAQILRVDVDAGEMANRVSRQERQYRAPLEAILPALSEKAAALPWNFQPWQACCAHIREELEKADSPQPGNLMVKEISRAAPAEAMITTDVGQNQVWTAQSWQVQDKQRVLFSGGHGAMGYGLPAAIGAAIAAKRPAICITGDGGLQMNIQEMQTVVRERLPIKIILFNNHALGMIHHFQEMYFEGNFAQTQDDTGFTVPDFSAIANAYGIRAAYHPDPKTLRALLGDQEPAFIEMPLPQSTYILPKLGLHKPIHQQEPALPPDIAGRVEEIYERFCSRENREETNE